MIFYLFVAAFFGGIITLFLRALFRFPTPGWYMPYVSSRAGEYLPEVGHRYWQIIVNPALREGVIYSEWEVVHVDDLKIKFHVKKHYLDWGMFTGDSRYVILDKSDWPYEAMRHSLSLQNPDKSRENDWCHLPIGVLRWLTR